MIGKVKITFMMFVVSILMSACCDANHASNDKNQSVNNVQSTSKKLNIQIILGSTRKGRTSKKIGNALKNIADKRIDITTEIIDLIDYNVPFLDDEIPPASRKEITDPVVKRWSDKIKEADAFIIVVPEYNSGYPGVLKNALDSLYKEWNNKPVAFVGYSGGTSGGTSAVAQLRQVALALQMIPIDLDITIGSAWKALDTKGNLNNKNIENELNAAIDQIIKKKSASKK